MEKSGYTLVSIALLMAISTLLLTVYASPSYDLNGDNKVDISDIAEAALAFGTRNGQDGWNANADVNSDGVVDIRDLVLIARAFGTHY